MKIICIIATVLFVFINANFAFAFKDKNFSIGLGYYSQNSLGYVSTKDNGKSSFLGPTFTPLNLRYDSNFSSDWFLSPQLSYTFIPRNLEGNTGKISFLHLALQFGKNISDSGNLTWDIYGGPGLIRYDIKGAGGTTVMNNGTSTATFAVPGGTGVVQKLTTNLGTSMAFGKSIFSFDVIIENAFSNKKRTESLMLSYAYILGGGY